jgi:hypothetical protein
MLGDAYGIPVGAKLPVVVYRSFFRSAKRNTKEPKKADKTEKSTAVS